MPVDRMRCESSVPCATPGGLVLATVRLPARGHSGVRARPKVPREACGAARCRRKSTLDPPYRLLHPQPRALEMTLRYELVIRDLA